MNSHNVATVRPVHEIIADCERRFQSGSGKVQVMDAEGKPVERFYESARKALQNTDCHGTVWARRKNRGTGRYEWRLIGWGEL